MDIEYNQQSNCLKVVAYTRVSTTMQIDGFSLENQEEDIIKYCKDKGYDLIHIFTDEGVSAKNENDREQFNQMMRYIADKGIEAIVIWKTSRLNRNFRDFINTLHLLEELGCRLISIKDGFDSSNSNAKLSIYMHGIIADMERENLQVQVSGGMYKRAKSGYFNGGKPPFGYDYDKMKKELIINEEEASVVYRIFSMYLEGVGYGKIAEIVNSRGFKTRMDNNFAISSVKQILMNPIYTGKIRWGYFRNWAEKRRAGRSEKYVMVDGQHERIVSDEMFDAVNEKIMNNSRHTNSGKPSNYLLSGILRCPECQYGMAVQKNTRKKYINHYYVCGGYKNKRGCSNAHSIKMELMDKQFVGFMNKYIENLSIDTVIKTLESNRSKDTFELDSKIGDLRSDIDKIRIKQTNLIKALEVEGAPIDLLTKSLSETEKEITCLEGELRNLEIKKNQSFDEIDPEFVFTTFKNIAKAFYFSNKERKRKLMKTFVDKVYVDKSFEIIQVVYRFSQSINLHVDEGPEKSFRITYDTVHRIIF